MAEITYRGALQGHSGWVTSIATTYEQSNLVVSGSRDKTAMVWELTPDNNESPGYARRCLHGHNQAVCDTVIILRWSVRFDRIHGCHHASLGLEHRYLRA
jgi:WD40 repeat protein